MNLRTPLFCIIALLCVLPVVHADVAPDPMSGGVSLITPGRNRTEITLLHNTVKLHLTPKLCRTRAFFRLQNTGEATQLEVGFPLIREGEATDFQVFVDEKPIMFEDKAAKFKTPIGQTRTRHWKAWDMKFEAEQTQLVEVRYSNSPAQGWSPTLSATYYPIFRYWQTTDDDYNLRDYGYGERVELHEWVAIKTVEYILVSGSYWKGPIKRCRVEADIENVAIDSIVEVRPPAKSFSAQHLVW